MNLFTVNQVNQVYVAKGTFASGSDSYTATKGSGNVYGGITPDGKSIYFKHAGMGGVVRTDLIDIDKIMYYKATLAKDMRTELKQYILTMPDSGWSALDSSGNYMKAGYDFILRITLSNYVGMSPEDSQYWKYGMVHTGPNMTPNAFWKEMAKSILRNMSREAVKFLAVYAVENGAPSGNELTLNNLETEWDTDYEGIAIREVEPDWILGLKRQKVINMEVTPLAFVADRANDDGETIYWGYSSATNIQTYDHKLEAQGSNVYINNGKLTADYEYFYHGERGDQYRKVGWPDYIPTEYMVDPSKEYDYFQIHYSYIGSNESCQKSEKDLTFLIPRTGSESSASTEANVTTAIENFVKAALAKETAQVISDQLKDETSDLAEAIANAASA